MNSPAVSTPTEEASPAHPPSEASPGAPSRPRGTYRLQLHAGFGFDQATEVIEYLRALGVSHLYLSPVLQATPGSMHGYDVTDPTRIDEARGGEEGFGRLAARLEEAGLGVVLDIVPNHLAVSPKNRWWWDVLENGPLGRWAHVFDVDWTQSPGEEVDARVLLPVLGDHYGRVLENHEIRLSRQGAAFVLEYYEHRFPVSPRTLDDLIKHAARSPELGSELADRLAFIGDALGQLPEANHPSPISASRRHRDKLVLARMLGDLLEGHPDVAAAVDGEVDQLNHDLDRLDRLHARQSYRLSFWRLAGTQLNYRRFFDINALVGVRVELPDVFDEGHELVLDLVARGVADGLRVDHPDGLRDPRAYFRRLAEAAPNAYIVAEKVLEPGERLRADWPIAGTTGYDFLNVVQGLFVDPRAEFALSETYRRFIREDQVAAAGPPDEERYADIVFYRKRAVCRELLAGDVTRVVALLRILCDARRRYRDFTSPELRDLVEVLASVWPVYRTYVSVPEAGRENEGVSPEDLEVIGKAIDAAKKRDPNIDTELLDLFERLMILSEPVLTGGYKHDSTIAPEHELVMRFQQLTGPVMAKGVEDTAFYRYNRLIALNEVGGDPARFGVGLRDFHADMAWRAAEAPLSMLATSTHDTKRSEDVRARLCVLSELPTEWAEVVERWAGLNDARRRSGAVVLDRNTEYLFYQTLVGVWPEPVGGDLEADFVERVAAFLLKAAKEAKAYTRWTMPNPDYEVCLDYFVRRSLEDPAFVREVTAFVERIRMSGWVNSLGQTLVKLTAPGVPDIYQGCELWDLSLVDPDNRRPVDFGLRRQLLAELDDLSSEAVWSRWVEGLPKLFTIRQTLKLRGERPGLFLAGYKPLEVRGELAEHVLGYLRGEDVAVIIPRLSHHISDFGDTTIELPLSSSGSPSRFDNLLTGERHEPGPIRLGALFKVAPIALLHRPGLSS